MEDKQNQKKEKIIHPLLIKDANTVMFWLTANILFLIGITEFFRDNKLYNFIVNFTIVSIILGFIFSIMIIIGWFSAIALGQVTYIIKQPKEKEGDKKCN